MGKAPRAGGRYVEIVDGNGAKASEEGGHGRYTLSANTLYYAILGGINAPFESAHLTGYTAGLVLTSVTVQDCNHEVGDVSNVSAVVGEWIDEKPTTAYVGTNGTGWAASSVGVVSAAGTGVGGAMFIVGATASARTRLAIQVGATGGVLVVSTHGKD